MLVFSASPIAFAPSASILLHEKLSSVTAVLVFSASAMTAAPFDSKLCYKIKTTDEFIGD